MPDVIYKICSTCEQEQPITEYHKQSSRKDGHSYQCKSCIKIASANRYKRDSHKIKAKTAEWTNNNKERKYEKSREWNANNPERIYEYQLRYRENNADLFRERSIQHYYNNTDMYRENSRQWAANNIDRVREINREYAKRNPDKMNHRAGMRRARKIQATPSWCEVDEINKLYIERVRITEKTGIMHHVDHIIPLNSDIVCGLHCIANLRIVPWHENLTKGNRVVEDL